MKPIQRTLKRARSALVFLALMASFVGVMQGIHRTNEQDETACYRVAQKAMQTDPMVGALLVEGCGRFQSTVEDVPPMMRLY